MSICDRNNLLSALLPVEVNPVTSSQYLLERNVLPINLVGGGSGINYISKTGNELSVRSNNVPELTGFFSRTAQLGILKINSDETSTSQLAYSGINSSQITVQKPGALEKTRLHVGIPQVTVTKFRSNQITTSQISTAQVDIAKFSMSEVDILQFNPTQVSVLYQDALKVSTPSSISSEQVFSSNFFHTLSPEFISSINNSALITGVRQILFDLSPSPSLLVSACR